MKVLFVALVLLFGHSGYYEAGRFNTVEECKTAQKTLSWSVNSVCVVKFEGTYKE